MQQHKGSEGPWLLVQRFSGGDGQREAPDHYWFNVISDSTGDEHSLGDFSLDELVLLCGHHDSCECDPCFDRKYH